MKPAAIYARVSSERQREQETIASQTTALLEHARNQNWVVPEEWRFLDEGYSGASLVRPGLDRLRDLVAEGQIDTILIYSPDRLSRKYAYQVLMTEEFSRHGAELFFLKSPPATTPEEQLLVQVQGMIAEYERAQIAERTRRGKRHRARQGSVNVLSGAPYGYRYMKKAEGQAAYYEIIDEEAAVVRMAYELFTVEQRSIGAITRRLNEQQIPTRTGDSRWERSTVWALLRNPAYVGRACFGKTELRPRKRVTRALRQKGGYSRRCGAHQERPREEWIEIAVPALISEASFSLAQEQLEKNKRFAARRTIEPTLLQGMLVCANCGYALYRTSTRTSKRKLYYYRCLGSDAWRHFKHPVCESAPVRQDYLDELVWQEVVRLLENPSLVQAEIDRRWEVAQQADPAQQRQEHLSRERSRIEKSVDRLLTAYQESLLSLDELRRRIEPLRKLQSAVQAELEALNTNAEDQQRYLRLVDNLAQFGARLRSRAATLELTERQKILRLLAKEVVVSNDAITIRHCLPIPAAGNGVADASAPAEEPESDGPEACYLLRSWSHHRPLRQVGFQANRRLLEVERLSHDCAMGEEAMHRLNRPVEVNGQRTSALRTTDLRVLALWHILVWFRLLPCGFANPDLREQLAVLTGQSLTTITQGRMTYDLRRLRLHGMIERIPKTHRYRVTAFGLRAALFFTRTHARLYRPAVAELMTNGPPQDDGLARQFARIEEEIGKRIQRANLAA